MTSVCQPRRLWNVGAEVGEGPIWIARESALYFVDILGQAIHCWRKDNHYQSWKTPAEPGFVFPSRGDGFICGLRGGLYHFDPAKGAFTLLMSVE